MSEAESQSRIGGQMSKRDEIFWDKTARNYAASPVADLAGLERTLARTGEMLAPPHHVLELGCGTGSVALRLAAMVESYLATDISSQMIAVAEEKLTSTEHEHLKGRLEFRKATSSQLAMEPARYDAVLGFNYLHLAGEPSAVLGNIRTLLKPKGLFISKTPCVGDMNPLIRLAIPLLRIAGKAPASVTSFSSASLAEEIRIAGFEILENERHGSERKDKRPFIVARAP